MDYEEIHLCLKTMKCFSAQKEISLTSQEFRFLHFFMENAGIVLTKQVILERVWNFDFMPEANVLEVSVSRLRTKLMQGSSRDYLQSIRRVGYCFR